MNLQEIFKPDELGEEIEQLNSWNGHLQTLDGININSAIEARDIVVSYIELIESQRISVEVSMEGLRSIQGRIDSVQSYRNYIELTTKL